MGMIISTIYTFQQIFTLTKQHNYEKDTIHTSCRTADLVM